MYYKYKPFINFKACILLKKIKASITNIKKSLNDNLDTFQSKALRYFSQWSGV